MVEGASLPLSHRRIPTELLALSKVHLAASVGVLTGHNSRGIYKKLKIYLKLKTQSEASC